MKNRGPFAIGLKLGERDRPGRSIRRRAEWSALITAGPARVLLPPVSVPGRRPETAGGTPALPEARQFSKAQPRPTRSALTSAQPSVLFTSFLHHSSANTASSLGHQQ